MGLDQFERSLAKKAGDLIYEIMDDSRLDPALRPQLNDIIMCLLHLVKPALMNGLGETLREVAKKIDDAVPEVTGRKH